MQGEELRDYIATWILVSGGWICIILISTKYTFKKDKNSFYALTLLGAVLMLIGILISLKHIMMGH